MIKIKNLCKKFDDSTPLIDVNCEIKDGEVVSIIGPSGAGKSTLIRCLNLLETPSSGQIYFDDVCITDKSFNPVDIRKQTCMVFQSYNLFSNYNVIENVMAALVDLKKIDKQKAYKIALDTLDSVGLRRQAFRFPNELSGGQKQRVAIARAIATKPKVLLLDEPTSALDPTMVDEVLNVIKKIANNEMTIIIVTHEINFAKEISNHVLYLDEGIIYEEGSPKEIFENPQKTKTKAFVLGLKTLKLTYSKSSYNYDDISIQINKYVKQNNISKELAFHLDIVLDELVLNNIFSHIDKYENVEIHIAKFSKSLLEIEILYETIKYNPYDHLDKISFKLLDNYVKDYAYQYIDNLNSIKFNIL